MSLNFIIYNHFNCFYIAKFPDDNADDFDRRMEIVKEWEKHLEGFGCSFSNSLKNNTNELVIHPYLNRFGRGMGGRLDGILHYIYFPKELSFKIMTLGYLP